MEDKHISKYQLTLSDLPKDMIKLIASFLDNKALLNFRLVNRYFEFISRYTFLNRASAQNKIIQIASGGDDRSYLLKANGVLYAWGRNDWGQLGSGHRNVCNSPQVVTTLKNVVSISVGYSNTFAITQDGMVYAWGHNNFSQLGLGHNSACYTPQVVTTLKNVVSISVGCYHSFAITQDGMVYAWGNNDYGQLGLGHNNNCNTPQVVTGLSNVVDISEGLHHTFAIIQDGTFYAWGRNNYGQLGLGHNTDCNTPQLVTGLSNVVSISAGFNNTFVITQDGTLYAWGRNNYGQLGLGHNTDCNTPQLVTGLSNVVTISVGFSSTGFGHSLGITKDGKLYAWGRNHWGQLGLGHKTDCNNPQVVMELKDAVSIATGENYSLAVTKNGTLYAWGRNNYSQLGLGSGIKMTNTPQQIPQHNTVLDIINSITKRERKQQIANIPLSLKIKQALLDQLKSLLPSETQNAPFFLSVVKFLATTYETKVAQGLRDFIAGKNSSIESIENAIQSHKTLNRQNNGPDKDALEKCLDEMINILEEAKKTLTEEIETELNAMIKRF